MHKIATILNGPLHTAWILPTSYTVTWHRICINTLWILSWLDAWPGFGLPSGSIHARHLECDGQHGGFLCHDLVLLPVSHTRYVLQGVQHWSVPFERAKNHRKQIGFCEHMGFFSRKFRAFWYPCTNFAKKFKKLMIIKFHLKKKC